MADVAAPSAVPLTTHGGPFSALARSQYRALASIRWSIFRNTIRTGRGALEAAAHGISYLIYALIGLGLGMGFGSGAYAIAATGKWAVVPVLFWALLLAWQVVPVSIASFQEQFDVNGLLRFPVGFGAFWAPRSVVRTCSAGWRLAWRYLRGSTSFSSAPSPRGPIAGWRSGARGRSWGRCSF